MEQEEQKQLIQERNKELEALIAQLKEINDLATRESLQNQLKRVKALISSLESESSKNVPPIVFSGYWKIAQFFGRKHFRILFLALLAGFILALIPIILFFQNPENFGKTEVYFIPNAIGYIKPRYVQLIDTPQKLDIVRHSPIIDRDLASIGSVVKLGAKGLIAISGEEMRSPGYHLALLDKPLEKEKKIIDGYVFIPDAIFSRDPVFIEILHSDLAVQAWKKKDISPKRFLKVGAAISCPKYAKCFVTADSTLKNDFIKISPITEALQYSNKPTD